MAVGPPPSPKLEIEFTSNVWTDVTSDLDNNIGVQINVGRTSETADAQVAVMTCQLRNRLGRYTPKSQLLTDGTAHPYYPNVQPRKRIRYSYSVPGGIGSPVVPNGAFETDLSGWTAAGSATITRDTTTFHDGVASMKLTYSGAGGEFAFSTPVTGLIPGASYPVTAWARAAVGQPRPQFSAKDTAGYEVFSPIGAADGAWHQLSWVFVATSNGTIEITCGTPDAQGAGSTMNVDTIVVLLGQAFRFTGYVKSWPQLLDNGVRPYVAITANDRGDQLSKVNTLAAPVQAMLSDAPFLLLPFDEPAGSSRFFDIVGDQVATGIIPDFHASGSFTAGIDKPVPYPDGLTGVQLLDAAEWAVYQGTLAGGSLAGGAKGIQCPAACNTQWTVEGWLTVQPGGTFRTVEIDFYSTTVNIAEIFVQQNTATTLQIFGEYQDATNAFTSFPAGGNVIAHDGAPHHYALTGSDNGTTLTLRLYVDGSLAATTSATGGSGTFGTAPMFLAGNSTSGTPGNVYGPVALYPAALSAVRIAQHARAGYSFTDPSPGLLITTPFTTAQRIREYLYWAGVASTDQALAAGVQSTGHHPTVGKNIQQLCQEMATTEGGGAVFYHFGDGRSTFLDRTYRNPGNPVLTLDAFADIDRGTFAPSYDDLTLVNSSTVARQDFSAQTYTDPVSTAQFGATTDTATSYADTDLAALNLAQSRVAANAYPGYRLGQVALDLFTASQSFYAALATVQIGSRIRVTNLRPASAPRVQADVFAEGWSETSSIAGYRLVFDTSPADNPPRGAWDNGADGRWRPDTGSMTLHTAISNSASTIVIDTVGPRTFTTNAGSYPLAIQIGEEVISLPSAPGGSTSPQTFTGALRGQQNSPAAAQSAGAAIDLYPAWRWAL
ncbi:MAG TPA: carbohydrate binding domain-containing protein [Pseudonocardiaceae bacterium]|nr:carbohydrate binding domain-containing protein [Pseudonocardiaceae bacterium]